MGINDTLDRLDIRREELYHKGEIDEKEYNHLYILNKDIRDLLSIAYRWTVRLDAGTGFFEKERDWEDESTD